MVCDSGLLIEIIETLSITRPFLCEEDMIGSLAETRNIICMTSNSILFDCNLQCIWLRHHQFNASHLSMQKSQFYYWVFFFFHILNS